MSRFGALPLSGFKGYKPKYVLDDVVAGIVIAALSIPIAMGYANIAGLPAVYGLYASVIAPLAFAFITGTKHIVFGMDSAAVAMTGGMLASIGMTLGSDQVIQAMPLLTLFTALFLIAFSVFKVGKVIRLVPVPVMHGFIVGISVSVILTQLPLLAGVSADTSGDFVTKVTNIFSSLEHANGTSVLLSLSCLLGLVLIKREFPRIPGALVILLVATALNVALSLSSQGVVTLEAVEAGLPAPALPTFEGLDVLGLLGCAFAIALVVALESLLCLETFSMKKGIRAQQGRELMSFGLSNVLVSLFGCPPCSASISRTAAGLSAGGHSQLAAMVAAVIVAVVALFCGPLLSYLPRAVLSSIVVLALIEVCDFSKIRRYATKMKDEFGIFLVSAVVVLVWGAIPGILVGFALSALYLLLRRKLLKNQELLGAVAYDGYVVPDKDSSIDPGFSVVRYKMKGSLSFLNIDGIIDKLFSAISDDTEAVIIKASKVETLDTTATDKLLQAFDMLKNRGIRVKIVRKVRPATDHYTRFELRTLMEHAKFYPNVRAAMESLSREYRENLEPQAPIDWIDEARANEEGILAGDRPVLTLTDKTDDGKIEGKLSYLQSHEVVLFQASYGEGEQLFDFMRLTQESDGGLLAEFSSGRWHYEDDSHQTRMAANVVASYMKVNPLHPDNLSAENESTL